MTRIKFSTDKVIGQVFPADYHNRAKRLRSLGVVTSIRQHCSEPKKEERQQTNKSISPSILCLLNQFRHSKLRYHICNQMAKQWSASGCGLKVTCSTSQRSDCSLLFCICFAFSITNLWLTLRKNQQ